MVSEIASWLGVDAPGWFWSELICLLKFYLDCSIDDDLWPYLESEEEEEEEEEED